LEAGKTEANFEGHLKGPSKGQFLQTDCAALSVGEAIRENYSKQNTELIHRV